MAGGKCLCVESSSGHGHASPPQIRSPTGASLALAVPMIEVGPSVHPRAQLSSFSSSVNHDEGPHQDIRDLAWDLAEARKHLSASRMEVRRLQAFNADLTSDLATLSEAAARAQSEAGRSPS